MVTEDIWPRLARRGKLICPECKHKTLVPYINEDGSPVGEGVGRCDREHKCGYHYTPRQYYHDNPDEREAPLRRRALRFVQEPPPTYFDVGTFKQSLRDYGSNNLVAFLTNLFGIDMANSLIERYYIGTSKYWQGATVFWQVDIHGHIRGGKIMQYDMNGKRVKEPFNKVTWAHKAVNIDGYHLKQCFYGEHLLRKFPNDIVAIYESEKTALLAAGALDGGINLSCGGCNNLSLKMCEALRGRDVILFPDNGKFDEWKDKGMMMRHLFHDLAISKLMESEAEKIGDDIGDLIAKRYPMQEPIRDFMLTML